jgi:hypothetical protein
MVELIKKETLQMSTAEKIQFVSMITVLIISGINAFYSQWDKAIYFLLLFTDVVLIRGINKILDEKRK